MLPRETQQQTLQTVESGARGETQPAKKTERYIVDMGSASAGLDPEVTDNATILPNNKATQQTTDSFNTELRHIFNTALKGGTFNYRGARARGPCEGPYRTEHSSLASVPG